MITYGSLLNRTITDWLPQPTRGHREKFSNSMLFTTNLAGIINYHHGRKVYKLPGTTFAYSGSREFSLLVSLPQSEFLKRLDCAMSSGEGSNIREVSKFRDQLFTPRMQNINIASKFLKEHKLYPAVTARHLSKTLNHCFVLRMGRKAVGPMCYVTHTKDPSALFIEKMAVTAE